MRYTYNIKVRDIVKFFVMRFDLATGTKLMFEEELFITMTYQLRRNFL